MEEVARYAATPIERIWPYLKPRKRMSRAAMLTIIMSTIFVPQIAHQFTCNQDVRCIFESMTSCLLSTVALVKLYTFYLNICKIRDCTKHLFVDWKELQTPEEHNIMKSYAENCRRFSLIYSVYCFTAVCLFMSVSIVPHVLDIVLPLNKSRPILLPYPGYYFVDDREYFIFIFCHSIIAWELLMAGIVAHDCMFVTYVEHVCSMFAVVGFRFEYLFYCHNNAIKIMTADLDVTYHKKIVFFVHMHREALKFAQLLENTFTVPFAIQVILLTIVMSSTLLQEPDVLEVMRYIFYVIGQLIHLFFLSLEGQKLIDHSLRMRDMIYNSFWYEAPVRSRKLLMLVMIQSLRPTFLSAGKVYVFSLESFTTVLQTSMSYFTVLASL